MALPKSTKITLTILVILALTGLYACLIEPFKLKVTKWEIESDKWTAQTELKIALISDVHAIWPWMSSAHIETIVKRTNALKPDLILLLGDYVGTHPFGIPLTPEQGVAPYKELSATCGVFAILGNHDLHGSTKWPEALIKTNIPVLQNKAISIECKNETLWIAGLEELWYQNTDIQNTIKQISDSQPVIMMMHNPDSFIDIPKSVTLSVAGHMHRGQIRLPVIGAIKQVLPSKFGKRFLYGHIKEEGKDLVVSGGLGMTGLPLRLLNPPEITLITLK